MLVDSKPNMTQQQALAVRSTSSTLSCTNRQELEGSDYALAILWPVFGPERHQ